MAAHAHYLLLVFGTQRESEHFVYIICLQAEENRSH